MGGKKKKMGDEEETHERMVPGVWLCIALGVPGILFSSLLLYPFTFVFSCVQLTYALYFGYMGLGCVGIALMCGAVGFAASFMFVLTIYGSIKVD